MALFLSKFENKLDRKGRVSVPAPYRAALIPQNFNGIILYPSHKFPALEACGIDRMEQLSASIDNLDLFSDEQDELAATIFADAQQTPFDSDGRIVLPKGLKEFANIEDKVMFVGAGPIFRLWEPNSFKEFQANAKKQVKEKAYTLRLNKREEGK
jgi:transcriptional regulator MraZ